MQFFDSREPLGLSTGSIRALITFSLLFGFFWLTIAACAVVTVTGIGVEFLFGLFGCWSSAVALVIGNYFGYRKGFKDGEEKANGKGQTQAV